MSRMPILCTVVIVTLAVAIQVNARPQIRHDEGTGTCRIIGEGPLEWESRSWGEGGQLFKKVCQSCHSRNNASGAPFLWVESKTSKGWNRIFAKRYPECARNGAWNGLSREQLLRVNDYLYRWAANSQDRNDNC